MAPLGRMDAGRPWRAAALQRAEEIVESRIESGLEADALNILANVRFSQQLYEDAMAAALRSVELAPNNANHHGLLAYILVKTGHARQGLRHFKLSTSLSPNYPPWFTNIVVLAHWLEGDVETAREAAENAVARFPDYYLAYVHLTGTLSALGLYEQARETAGEVLRRQPDFSLREYEQQVFFQDPEISQSWIGYLRKAGLPD